MGVIQKALKSCSSASRHVNMEFGPLTLVSDVGASSPTPTTFHSSVASTSTQPAVHVSTSTPVASCHNTTAPHIGGYVVAGVLVGSTLLIAGVACVYWCKKRARGSSKKTHWCCWQRLEVMNQFQAFKYPWAPPTVPSTNDRKGGCTPMRQD